MKSFEKNVIDSVDHYVQHQTNNGNFSGQLLLAKSGTVFLNKGYGYANHEKEIFNNSDTQFRIASITKPFTATIILQLQEQGLLKLTNPLSHFLPAFPRGNGITIHHLLSHTSGIYNFSLLPDIVERITQPTTASSIIELFKDMPMAFEPGTNCAYSN